MRIIWDEPKRISNLAKHGLDFADMTEFFDLSSAVVLPAKAGRFKLISMLHEAQIVAAVTALVGREALSVISLRPASRKGRELYER